MHKMASDNVSGLSLLTQERINKAFNQTCGEIAPTHGRFVLLTEQYHEDAKAICDECFSWDEPISRSLGVRWNSPGAVKIWDEILAQNISLGLVDETTGEIMAERFIKLDVKDTNESLESSDPEVDTFFKVMLAYAERAKISEHFAYQEVFHFMGLATRPKYRQHGYATQIMKFAIQFLQNLQLKTCRLVKGEASSLYSQKIYEKLGFKCIYMEMFSDYNIDGEPVIKDMERHTSIKFYALEL